MKPHLAKLSLALLSTVFLLGCQDMGSEPLGPDGLVPQFAKVKNCEPPGKIHPSCKLDEEDDRPIHHITVSGDISSDKALTTARRRPENLVVDVVELDLSFFDGMLTCNLGVQDDGRIQIDLGRDEDHLHLFFSFELNGISHYINFILEPAPIPWPPMGVGLTLNVVDREWVVGTGRKVYEDACTGNGGPGETNPGIDFTILIEPV